MDERARINENRASWDERTAIHVNSAFYDVDGFLAGDSTLAPFEAQELGSVDGARLVHLQCHFGLDTLSWARLGAEATGVDISGAAIDAARALAERAGIDAEFVESDVYDARSKLEGTFDVVYTGHGALNWLPDLERWAEVVSSLLAPGGRFYIVEFHPILNVMDDDDLVLDPTYPFFFDPEGMTFDDDEDYADPQASLVHSRTHEWAHPVSEVVGSLIDAGLAIDALHEFDVISYQRWPFLERVDGPRPLYKIPSGKPQVPLEYSIVATKHSGA